MAIEHTIELNGITYTVIAHRCERETFAHITAAEGLEKYTSDQLASHFDEDTHMTLSVLLRRKLRGQS